MPTPKWPDEDVSKLKALWAAGNTAETIAAEFRRKYTRSGIIGKVHRLKLPMRDTTGRERASQVRTHKPKITVPGPSLKKDAATDIGHITNEPNPIGPLRDFPAAGACRFPSAGEVFKCCGHPCKTDSPYCSHHHARAHQSQTGKSSVNKSMIAKSGILRAFGG